MRTHSLHSFLFASAAAITVGSASAQGVILSDDFEVDTSANYTIVDNGTPDGTQDFAFDYVAAGMPLAPRSAMGDTGGLKVTANNTAGVADHWTLFHNTMVAAPHYSLTVDVWMNFVGTAGTTEFSNVGVGGDGLTFNSYALPTSGSGAFISFTGDGGAASDYRWYRDALNTPAGEPDSGTLPGTHYSYLGHGANASGAFYQALFPAPPSTIQGSPGNIWTTVVIDVDNVAGVISFYFDGVLTFQGNFANDFSGLVSLGITDIFTSISLPDNFIIYDNLVVESVSSSVGTNYCTANANSTGATGVISAVGSDVVSANNLTLTGSNLPNNAFGFFLASQMQGLTMNPGGSSGNLCLGGAIGRYVGPGQIQHSGMSGEISLALDLTMIPQPTGFVAAMAGDTWNFTAWHRDAVGGSATSNFTDGLEITFQ